MSYLISAYLEVYKIEQVLQLINYIHSSSPFYQEQVSYMESINKQGIDIRLIDYSIFLMEQVADHRYEVSLEEHYT
ncbi:TcaA NTF2-like domain-containing protein, partial [Lysinibacillus fusiformis]|uniref:TcaA NTF2-like domain-containing protein n=1 Tax=Lysinibacillus fusiformis TaxID=28031 RepID=UPI0020BF5BBD